MQHIFVETTCAISDTSADSENGGRRGRNEGHWCEVQQWPYFLAQPKCASVNGSWRVGNAGRMWHILLQASWTLGSLSVGEAGAVADLIIVFCPKKRLSFCGCGERRPSCWGIGDVV